MSTKTILTLCCLLTVLFNASTASAALGLDVRAGLVRSDVTAFTGTLTADSVQGFAGGVGYEFTFLSDRFAIRPELNFVQRGMRLWGTIFDQPFDAAIQLNFLELPVLFKARVPMGPVRLTAVAGVYGAYLVGWSATLLARALSGAPDRPQADFGVQLGAGLEIPFAVGGGSGILLDMRVAQGLTYPQSNLRSIWFSLGVRI